MIETQKHILFFDFLQKYFPFDNALNVVKKNFVKEDKTVVKSSHSSLENILIEDKISPTSVEKPLNSLPEKRKSLGLKTNSQKNIERIEKKLSDLKIEQPGISNPSKTILPISQQFLI